MKKTKEIEKKEQNQTFYVGVGSTIDYSRWDSFSTNSKIEEVLKPDGLIYYEVNSLKEASELAKKFIKEYRLSSSNWLGGIVLDNSLNFIANVSYNGRVWDNKDWRIAKEIEVC